MIIITIAERFLFHLIHILVWYYEDLYEIFPSYVFFYRPNPNPKLVKNYLHGMMLAFVNVFLQ